MDEIIRFEWGDFSDWIELIVKIGVTVIVWSIIAVILSWIFGKLIKGKVKSGGIKQRHALIYQTIPFGILTAFLLFESGGASPLRNFIENIHTQLGPQNSWLHFIIDPINNASYYLFYSFRYGIHGRFGPFLDLRSIVSFFIVTIAMALGFSLVLRLSTRSMPEIKPYSVKTMLTGGVVLSIVAAGIEFIYLQPILTGNLNIFSSGGVSSYLLMGLGLLVYPLMAYILTKK